MAIDTRLQRLIDANALLWAGEAEVVRTYWDSPVRTRETDLLWLSRQCYKEFWAGVAVPFERLKGQLDEAGRGFDHHEALDTAKFLYEEFSHYCLFADVHESLRREGEPPVNPHDLKRHGDWPENAALGRVRADHRKTHGRIGARARDCTEGGGCTLYSEGMKLKGRGGADDLIGEACAKVYEDEIGHMLNGISGLQQDGLSEAEWDLVTELTVEQMKYRIPMRNAQFSHPLSEERMAEILAGRIEPFPFDYQRIGLAPAES